MLAAPITLPPLLGFTGEPDHRRRGHLRVDQVGGEAYRFCRDAGRAWSRGLPPMRLGSLSACVGAGDGSVPQRLTAAEILRAEAGQAVMLLPEHGLVHWRQFAPRPHQLERLAVRLQLVGAAQGEVRTFV